VTESSPIVHVDIMADGSVFLGRYALSSPSSAPEYAASRALKSLGTPMSAVIHFRTRGALTRAVRLDHLVGAADRVNRRGDA
jgi:hypothetical protein